MKPYTLDWYWHLYGRAHRLSVSEFASREDNERYELLALWLRYRIQIKIHNLAIQRIADSIRNS